MPSAIMGAVPEAPRTPRLRYAPGLDGLRAVAVLAVVAYHADAAWLPGGFLGVGVFLVLSSFLITSLLLVERGRTGGIRLPAFWARRARRLLPALLVMLAVLCLWAQWWADPIAQDRFRGEALSGLGYFANWHFATTGTSYFDTFGAASPVRHLWSLAIEEQFYLVWPLVVAGVLAVFRFGRRALLALALVGAVASAVTMALLYDGGDPSRVYFGTDTHAFGLLFGASLAVLTSRTSSRSPGRASRPAGWIGLGALVALLAAYASMPDDSAFTYRGGIVLVSLATVPLVYAASRPGPVTTILSWRPLVAIGVVSYGIYLWHWPVWTILDEQRLGIDGAALDAARLGILAAVTVASYYLVERPIRHGGLRGWRIRVLAPAAVGGVAALVVVTTVAPPVFTRPVAVPAANTTRSPTTTAPPGPPPKPALMVVGDSTGGSAVQGFESVLGDRYHVLPGAFVPETEGDFCPLDLDVEATRDAGGKVKEGPPEPACDWSAKWPAMVRGYRPRVVVVMFGLWDARPHRVHGVWLQPGTDAWSAHLAERARCGVATLSAYGTRVVIMLSPLTVQIPDGWVRSYNRVMSEVSRADPTRVVAVDVNDLVQRVGVGYRWDGVHYTEVGARAIAAPLRAAVDAADSAPAPPLPVPPPSCAPGTIA